MPQRLQEQLGVPSITIAGDLNDLRLALGIDKLILVGIGYGAHLALETIRRYPDVIHSAVLVGTEGPNHTFKLPSTYDAQLKVIWNGEEIVCSKSIGGGWL